MPSIAQTVAVATPCCPAPVSAMMRRFPMLRASNAWPSALLILCAPVCARSSRFRKTRAPPRWFVRDSAKYTGVGRSHGGHTRPHLVFVFGAAGLDAAAHIQGPGTHAADGLANVVGTQPAREHDRRVRRDGCRDAPIEGHAGSAGLTGSTGVEH